MNKLSWCFVLLLLGLRSITAYAQQVPPPNFRLFFEKAYLHTDKDIYTQGDTLWYKAYLVNAQDNKPINTSHNLYVELIAPDSGKIVNRQIIRLNAGSGHGDFSLPDSIPAGRYQLRAYTNWMRNFGNNFLFGKEILIVSISTEKEKPMANNSLSVSKELPVASSTAMQQSPPFVLRFYPESGALIENVNSMVAVKYENGSAAKGAIVNNSGDTITHFNCDTLGLGLFALLPLKGQSYYAVLNSSPQKTTVTSALKTGFALRVTRVDSIIRVIINCNEATIAAYAGKTITLSGKHGGTTCFTQQIALAGTQVVVKIPASIFPEGVAALTFYEDNKPHCERLIYVHHNNSAVLLTVMADKLDYLPKEKTTLTITSPGYKANLSVAVVDADIAGLNGGNVDSYLMLQSEIRGRVEHADRYFDTTNVNRFKQLDRLLLTQGWREYLWRRLADTAIRISYATEQGVNFSGKIISETNYKSIPALNLSLYAPGARGNKLYQTITDSAGRFNLFIPNIYGQQDIRLSSFNAKGVKTGKILLDTATTLPFLKAVENRSEYSTDTAFNYLKNNNQKYYALLNQKRNSTVKLKAIRVTASRNVNTRNGVFTSWGTDQVFNITDKDNKFKTLEWYLLQNAKGALQSNRQDTSGVVFAGLDTSRYQVLSMGAGSTIRYRAKAKLLPPQLFINGRELDMNENVEAETYRDTYFNLPIEKFTKIVLKRVVGNLVGGIRNLKNKDSNAQAQLIVVDRYLLYLYLKEDAFRSNTGTLSLNAEGYYQAREFYKPMYPNTDSGTNQLDRRTATIHWQPILQTDSSGKATVDFYNTNGSRKVNIVVQGITETGIPIYAVSSYMVK